MPQSNEFELNFPIVHDTPLLPDDPFQELHFIEARCRICERCFVTNDNDLQTECNSCQQATRQTALQVDAHPPDAPLTDYPEGLSHMPIRNGDWDVTGAYIVTLRTRAGFGQQFCPDSPNEYRTWLTTAERWSEDWSLPPEKVEAGAFVDEERSGDSDLYVEMEQYLSELQIQVETLKEKFRESHTLGSTSDHTLPSMVKWTFWSMTFATWGTLLAIVVKTYLL